METETVTVRISSFKKSVGNAVERLVRLMEVLERERDAQILTRKRTPETFEFDYDGGIDRWNGYDVAMCRSHLNSMGKKGTGGTCRIPPDEINGDSDDDEDNENALKVDEEEAKVDLTELIDSAQVEKKPPVSSEFKHLRKYFIREKKPWEAPDVHLKASPTQAELLELEKNDTVNVQKRFFNLNEILLEMCGNSATEPKQPLPGQIERGVQYDRAAIHYNFKDYSEDRFDSVALQEMTLPKSKYEEDNNHTAAWSSWREDHQWGYKCCKQFVGNTSCAGAAGIEAATDLMNANVARKEVSEGGHGSI